MEMVKSQYNKLEGLVHTLEGQLSSKYQVLVSWIKTDAKQHIHQVSDMPEVCARSAQL